MKRVILDGNILTLEQLSLIAYGKANVSIAHAAKKRMSKSRALVERWIRSGETVYGITTGFGEFANVRIDANQTTQLQENLILSHAAGSGDPLPPEIVRGMMALRINALAKGYSGIRVEVVEHLMKMLNANIVPVIPSQGSVGCSGDLVQLSHLVLAMMGKSAVWDTEELKTSLNYPWFTSLPHETIDSNRALKRAKMKPITLTSKEGLALINGTQMMSTFTGLAAEMASILSKTADIAASLTTEALRGSDTAFDARIHRLRPYRGQLNVAENLRRLMKGSDIRESHRHNDNRVQDAYSIRCIPQVHGASRDAINYVYHILSTEINSANDNPLIFPEDEAHLEGGNFHGQPIALAADFLAIALAELASISERRIERLMNGTLSGLPKFLTRKGGLNSGLMIAQYTAASIVSENKVLCHPGSVDSIPTSANQEDHNSMGSVSARKLWQVLRNVQRVIAIELLCAAQALDFVKYASPEHELKAGKGVEAAYTVIRSHIDFMDQDRFLYPEIQKSLELLFSGKILTHVEQTIGLLK
jgi:histidine ammonia-lyase